LKLEYAYNDRDLPVTLTESDAGGMFAEVTFTYDNRGRLIAENRSASSGPSPEYDLEYVYEQAGNRLYKIDHLAELQTHYVYDVDDVPEYGSDNNRLQYYTVWDTGGEVIGSGGDDVVCLRRDRSGAEQGRGQPGAHRDRGGGGPRRVLRDAFRV
ncbi:MAG: hypothetical protein L6Q93_16895, partial [Phycisphaerae bacterium]|nr:hypothetical protein [Phycisphaerae bacterium]